MVTLEEAKVTLEEVLPSSLCRAKKERDGYIAYTYAAEDFFLSPKTRPDIEFVNVYSDGLLKELEKIKPFSVDILVR